MISITASGLADGGLSGEEERLLQAKLLGLLAERVQRYTMGESSSVTIETARALADSVRFTLEGYLRKTGQSRRFLVRSDLKEVYRLGIKVIEDKIETGRRLWGEACLGGQGFGNIAYRDTLREIGAFFRRYDYRYFAQDIPCAVDYQLCRAVPETLMGVDYIKEYLRRLITENRFLSRFDSAPAARLLGSACREYKDYILNLYEPVAANALGLALLGEDPRALRIDAAGRARIAEILGGLDETRARAALRDAASGLCRALDLTDAGDGAYHARTAEELFPRIASALPSGNLAAVFQDFGGEAETARGQNPE